MKRHYMGDKMKTTCHFCGKRVWGAEKRAGQFIDLIYNPITNRMDKRTVTAHLKCVGEFGRMLWHIENRIQRILLEEEPNPFPVERANDTGSTTREG